MAQDPNKKVSLSDILNYRPDTYLSIEEVSLIQNTFKDNARLLNVLRKVMLPSVGNPDLPIEQIEQDVWLQSRDYSMIPNEEIKSIVLARQEAIKFITGGLIKLKIIASGTQETATERALREKRNSMK